MYRKSPSLKLMAPSAEPCSCTMHAMVAFYSAELITTKYRVAKPPLWTSFAIIMHSSEKVAMAFQVNKGILTREQSIILQIHEKNMAIIIETLILELH